MQKYKVKVGRTAVTRKCLVFPGGLVVEKDFKPELFLKYVADGTISKVTSGKNSSVGVKKETKPKEAKAKVEAVVETEAKVGEGRKVPFTGGINK